MNWLAPILRARTAWLPGAGAPTFVVSAPFSWVTSVSAPSLATSCTLIGSFAIVPAVVFE